MVAQEAVLDADHLVGADVVVVRHRHPLDPLADLGEGVNQDEECQKGDLNGRGGVGAQRDERHQPDDEDGDDEPSRQLVVGFGIGGPAAPQ